jgi:chromosome segregation ATPase
VFASSTFVSSAFGQAKNTAFVEAQKRISESQTKVNELKAEQKRIKEKLSLSFESKEEFKNTTANYKKAKADYDAARKTALAGVQAKPEYKQLVKDKEALQAKYNTAVAANDTANISKVGSDIAAKGIKIKNMEKEATDQDDKVVTAKEKLEAAEKEKKSLDDEVEANLATDPDYAAIQQQVTQAETELTQQKEQLAQQKKAEQQAHAAQSKAASESRRAASKSRSSSGGSRSGGGY